MLTGIAFPLGAVLGVLFGVATAPRDSQGFGDVAYAMLWFIVAGAPLTMLTFWRTTRNLAWTRAKYRAAMLGMAMAAFQATGLLIASIWLWGRSGGGGFIFLTLPLCSIIVTLRARTLLKDVA